MPKSNKISNIIISLFVFLMIGYVVNGCDTTKDDLNVLVITGGKKIEKKSFLKIFDDIENINYSEISQPDANNIYFSSDVDKFDVLVFYDFVQEINDSQKRAFLELLDNGKSMLFLHHSLVSYQDWDEYEKIVGGRYYQSTNKADSVKYVQSTYRHDVQIPVQIVDKEHPITKGFNDFTIYDEVYGKYKIHDYVNPILTTTHPENEKILGWTNKYGNSNIVYIQLGDSQNCYEDKNYRRLVKQAIEWLGNI